MGDTESAFGFDDNIHVYVGTVLAVAKQIMKTLSRLNMMKSSTATVAQKKMVKNYCC